MEDANIKENRDSTIIGIATDGTGQSSDKLVERVEKEALATLLVGVERHSIDDGPDEGGIDSISSNMGDSINESIFDELDGITLELCAGGAILEDDIKIWKVGPIGSIKSFIDPGKIGCVVFTKAKLDILKFGPIADDTRNCHGKAVMKMKKVVRGTCCCVRCNRRMIIIISKIVRGTCCCVRFNQKIRISSKKVGRGTRCVKRMNRKGVVLGTGVVEQKKSLSEHTKKSV